MAKKRTPAQIRARGSKLALENAEKLPSKQRSNLGPRTVYNVNNEAAQQSDRKLYEEAGGVRRGSKR